MVDVQALLPLRRVLGRRLSSFRRDCLMRQADGPPAQVEATAAP